MKNDFDILNMNINGIRETETLYNMSFGYQMNHHIFFIFKKCFMCRTTVNDTNAQSTH